MLVHGKMSPPTGVRQEHAAPVATPHLPITATTKVAELKSPGSPSSPVTEDSPAGQSAATEVAALAGELRLLRSGHRIRTAC